MLEIMAIPLSQGLFALVDGKNYEELNKYKWRLHKVKGTCYAIRYLFHNEKRKFFLMHRQILGLQYGDGIMTDHANHCGLDNRMTNIRTCTRSQNAQNSRVRKDSKSGFKGVYWREEDKFWYARIKHNGVRIRLGCFKKKEDAIKAYDDKARELFGEFACLNCPRPTF